MIRADRKVVASAGEHFVCSVLSQLGWAAALTREGVARADILAVHADELRQMIEVQVKTISPSRKPSWPRGGKWLESSASEREWYVFVLLASDPRMRPRCFVVPYDHATAGAYVGHQHWRTHPTAAPGKRNTPLGGQTRAGVDLWERYEEAWELLDQSAREVEVRLPAWVRDVMDEPRIGFPDWHPWRTGGVPKWMPE